MNYRKIALIMALFLIPLVSVRADVQGNFLEHVRGKILLQVEGKGAAWYVNPADMKRYYMGFPKDAFNLMRKLGLGATHEFITGHTVYPKHVWGKILLDIEDKGKAYYINSANGKGIYLGSPKDAFNIMREVGLGIKNNDLEKISLTEEEKIKNKITTLINKNQFSLSDITEVKTITEEENFYKVILLSDAGDEVICYVSKNGEKLFYRIIYTDVNFSQNDAKGDIIKKITDISQLSDSYIKTEETPLFYKIFHKSSTKGDGYYEISYLPKTGEKWIGLSFNLTDAANTIDKNLLSAYLYLGVKPIEKMDEYYGYKRWQNYEPMIGYSLLTKQGKQYTNYENFSYFTSEIDQKRLNPYYEDTGIKHSSYYTVDSSGKNYALRIKRGDDIFSVVWNGKEGEKYDHLDQIMFSPDGKSLVYRARKDKKWYIIVNNKSSEGYDYVCVVAYTADGALNSIVKKTENGKETWLVLKNDEIIKKWDYADDAMYLPEAKGILYRAKELTSDGEKWFIVINNKKQKEWDYVDKLNIELDKNLISYRTRDNQGNFYIELLDNDAKKNYEIIDNSGAKIKEQKVIHAGGGYTIIEGEIYYCEQKINADLETFKYLEHTFAKDKNHAYRSGIIVEDADPATFEVLAITHAKDKNNVYFNGKKLENADPATFELLAPGYTKDKNNVYFNETRIKEANAETFKVTGYWEAKDKNYKYYRADVKEPITK